MEASYFKALSEQLVAALRGSEVLTLFVESEQSDFVRFNEAKVRQAGTVTQGQLLLDLIDGLRHAPGRYTLSGLLDEDVARGHAQGGASPQTRAPMRKSPPFWSGHGDERKKRGRGQGKERPLCHIGKDSGNGLGRGLVAASRWSVDHGKQ